MKRISTFFALFRGLAAAVLFGALLCLSGCDRSRQLGGMELQTMKKEEIKKNAATITPEQQIRITGIQARTRAEFEREVEKILREGRSRPKSTTPAVPKS